MAKKKAALKRRTPSRAQAKPHATARAAMKKLAKEGTAIAAIVPPLKTGEVYAGLIVKDGKPVHHLVLLPGEASDVTWTEAKAFADKAGGALPTRKEQALLFANAAEHFQPRAYWSGEQYAGNAEYAWDQFFDNGYQGTWRKDFKTRARAVRRVTI